MSDDITKTDNATTEPVTPDNVVTFTPAASSEAAPSQPDVSDVTETPAAEQPAGPQISNIHDAVNHVISQVDINTVSHHDVIHDLFQTSQEIAFKLLLAAKLFEQMLIRDSLGLKGQVYDLLRHADEAVVNEIHDILKAKVTVPVPVAAPSEDQAVS
jgi:hypothetical protein